MPIILGMTIVQWVILIRRALVVLKFILAFAVGYAVLNKLSPFDMVMLALNKIEGFIPVPHKMTPEEEKVWFDRQSMPGSG